VLDHFVFQIISSSDESDKFVRSGRVSSSLHNNELRCIEITFQLVYLRLYHFHVSFKHIILLTY
jgi:hypothetical protein